MTIWTKIVVLLIEYSFVVLVSEVVVVVVVVVVVLDGVSTANQVNIPITNNEHIIDKPIKSLI